MILNSLVTDYYYHKDQIKYMSKFKRNILASILIISGGMLSNLSMANAYDGKITFSGNIRDSTCEISGGNVDGTIAENNPNFTVSLPPVGTLAFKTPGDKAGDTAFFIKLKGANCAIGDGYAIKFEKISSSDFIDSKTGYLKNMNTTGAKNIQLVISDEDGKTFDFSSNNDTSPTKNRDTTTEETVFKFGVQYISTATGVTPGGVEGNIFYSVVYP